MEFSARLVCGRAGKSINKNAQKEKALYTQCLYQGKEERKTKILDN